MIPILDADPESGFPPVEKALDYPPGLLAAGGDLHPARLLKAYSQGIFPWYSEDEPILWWSPAPRCVIYPDQVHLSRRLRRRYNQGHFQVTADTRFNQVIDACAEPRSDQEGTWITEEMNHAYKRLHRMGHAHSVEVWSEDRLAGGIYGISIGAVFFGESMFSRETDASKVALIALCRQLNHWKYELLDCQVSNPHLVSMGAIEISRQRFQTHLLATGKPDQWRPGFSCERRW